MLHTNKKHPFLTVEKGFVPVGQIKLGMHVVEADGQVGMVNGWKLVPGVKTMYNLEVAQDHTYTVGIGQWVVHNSDCQELAQQAQSQLENLPRNVKAVSVTNATDQWGNTIAGTNGTPGETAIGNSEAATGRFNGACAETHCAAQLMGSDVTVDGNEINMGLAHRGGAPPCPDCGANLQSLADQRGMPVNVGYYDSDGNYMQELFEPAIELLLIP